MLELAELEQSGESLRDFKQKNKNDQICNALYMAGCSKANSLSKGQEYRLKETM